MPSPSSGEAAEIRFEQREGYLYASVSGERDSLAISLDYWTRVIRECERCGSERLLVEEAFENQLPTTDIFDLSAIVSGMATARSLKIAFVDRELSHRSLNEFGETVAANRGVFVRVFNSAKDAEAWLATRRV